MLTPLATARTGPVCAKQKKPRGQRSDSLKDPAREAHHVQMVRNIRRSASQEQGSKVDGTADDGDELVPPEEDEHPIHPHWDLRDGANHAPLRLEVVGVRLATEARSQVVSLRLGQDDEGGGEVKLGGIGRGDGVGRGGVKGRREGESVARVDRGDARVEGNEGEDLRASRTKSQLRRRPTWPSSTYRLLGLLEDGIDIIIRLPHARHSLVVVAELIFKQQLELDEHDRLGRLLVNLGAQRKP